MLCEHWERRAGAERVRALVLAEPYRSEGPAIARGVVAMRIVQHQEATEALLNVCADLQVRVQGGERG